MFTLVFQPSGWKTSSLHYRNQHPPEITSTATVTMNIVIYWRSISGDPLLTLLFRTGVDHIIDYVVRTEVTHVYVEDILPRCPNVKRTPIDSNGELNNRSRLSAVCLIDMKIERLFSIREENVGKRNHSPDNSKNNDNVRSRKRLHFHLCFPAQLVESGRKENSHEYTPETY
jgi:hypothetical protein